MPSSVEGLAVVLVAVIPGAMFTWGFESEAGQWGMGAVDRILRFVGVSASLHAISFPAVSRLVGELTRPDPWALGGAPLWVWPLMVGYVAVPYIAGRWVGIATRTRRKLARVFTGPAPEPRAWDYLFGHNPVGWVRMKLKSGIWLGGVFATDIDGRRSYAAGYPHLQDLYLIRSVAVDPRSGEFRGAGDGRLLALPGEAATRSSLLVRWEEVEYLEFIEPGPVREGTGP